MAELHARVKGLVRCKCEASVKCLSGAVFWITNGPINNYMRPPESWAPTPAGAYLPADMIRPCMGLIENWLQTPNETSRLVLHHKLAIVQVTSKEQSAIVLCL